MVGNCWPDSPLLARFPVALGLLWMHPDGVETGQRATRRLRRQGLSMSSNSMPSCGLRTVKRLLVTLPIACALVAGASTAHAQGESKDCAPGSWFCGETAPPPAGGNKDLQPLPSDGQPAAKP